MPQGLASTNILAATLRRPEEAASYRLKAWERLIGHARGADLLGQLRHRLDDAGLLASVPAQALRHLDTAWQLSLRHRQAVRWELEHISKALDGLDAPVIVLKGAAYCLADLEAAAGRVFNDVDILVPREVLREAEEAFMDRGWLPDRTSRYDQRYYREWMHELPPMQHKDRGTVLDIHHTIVPPTSGIVPDPVSLIASAQPIEGAGLQRFSVLSREDMVIHSACHLFFNEFHKGLRDLYDLHWLLRDAGKDQGFWESLVTRSLELGLGRPLHDALEWSVRVFATPVPNAASGALAHALGPPALAPVRKWMFERVFLPHHPSCSERGLRFARWLAFVRSHWLRMPLPLLIYHLGHKALKGDTH